MKRSLQKSQKWQELSLQQKKPDKSRKNNKNSN